MHALGNDLTTYKEGRKTGKDMRPVIRGKIFNLEAHLIDKTIRANEDRTKLT